MLHHLPKLQNMHDYRVDANTDITDFVNSKFVELEGPPHVAHVHFFSKNLLAYLETLVAFCPYYKEADPRMAGKMETFFQQAVKRYEHFKSNQLNEYIARKLNAWCKQYRPKQASTAPAQDEEDIEGEEGDVVDVPSGEAVQTFTMFPPSQDEEEEESASPAAAAAAAPAATAAAAPAAAGDGGVAAPAASDA